jgi:hypothetical protein
MTKRFGYSVKPKKFLLSRVIKRVLTPRWILDYSLARTRSIGRHGPKNAHSFVVKNNEVYKQTTI